MPVAQISDRSARPSVRLIDTLLLPEGIGAEAEWCVLRRGTRPDQLHHNDLKRLRTPSQKDTTGLLRLRPRSLRQGLIKRLPTPPGDAATHPRLPCTPVHAGWTGRACAVQLGGIGRSF